MVITKKNKNQGDIDGQAIWEVAGTEILGDTPTTLHLKKQVSIPTQY